MSAKILKVVLFFIVVFLTACTKYDCPPTVSNKPIVKSMSCPLAADYEFSGNTNDASSYNIKATNYGATLTTDRFGNANSAYSFNGVNEYMDGDTSNRGITSEVTISAWI